MAQPAPRVIGRRILTKLASGSRSSPSCSASLAPSWSSPVVRSSHQASATLPPYTHPTVATSAKQRGCKLGSSQVHENKESRDGVKIDGNERLNVERLKV